MSSSFGRYTLIRRLAAGGMAEVWLAEQHGIEGFEKLVVLKRILPHLSQEQEFVRMFLDEARTAADLGHPNVVNIFDAGVHDGTYFITMEYLRGKDLAGVVAATAAAKQSLNVPAALRMVIDAARGLHSAHTKTGRDGQPLGIIHRDISPQNIFVTWDGVTKVLDFGIAHAATRATRTEAGVLKGKLAYLAPEALEGLALDARSDQFALGVVAWELLTSRRLFQRPSEAEVLRAILEPKIPPPRTLVPALPAAAEAAVLKALSADREARFLDCAAFGDALEDCLEAEHLPHSPRTVAQVVRALFPQESTGSQRLGAVEPPPPPPKVEEPTRPDRKRPALPGEADFFAVVAKHLGAEGAPRKSNVVPSSGAFVGRGPELKALRAHFDEGARLVTVVAFGGMGKTALAQAYALEERALGLRAGGAWFCDLAAARTPDDLCKAVAQALSVQVPGGASPDDSVTLAGRSLKSLGPALVVLDNFEQVVGHAAVTVGRWLEQAPEVRLLVTSRESLRLPGEVVMPLSPLSIGPGSEAVQLFCARAAEAGALIKDDELGAVAELCERLEGHALAIELAAARAPALKVRDIIEKLQTRFRLLGGQDPAKGRHGTLWNAIDWSWQLLSPAEQSALAQLSVFRGGFTPEVAEEVLELTAFPGAPSDFEVVAALHRKSFFQHFLSPDDPGQLRLRMLDSIHEFAAEQADALQVVAAARTRHGRTFLRLGAQWASALAVGNVAAMGHLFAERANLLEVFTRALSVLPPSKESGRVALEALHVLKPVFQRRGPFAMHLAFLEDALRIARDVKVAPALIARGLQQRGNAWRARGQLNKAVEDLLEADQLVRGLDDAGLAAAIACDLAVARFVLGQVEVASEGFEKALALARQAGDEAIVLRSLAFVGIVAVAMNQHQRARAACDEALPLARSRQDAINEARLLGTLGSLYHDEGKLELAQAFFIDAGKRCKELKELRLQGYFLGRLAWVRVARGALEEARRTLSEALQLMWEVGDLRHEGLFLDYQASLCALEGDFDAARMALGSAQVRLDAVKDPLLLTAHAVRAMEVDVRARAAGRPEAEKLLADVRAAREARASRMNQSEEVRLAVAHLERALAGR